MAKKTNIPKKNGRPKKLQNIDYEEVEKLAALGLTDLEIAEYLGVCRATLANYKNDDNKFLDTIKKGKLKADINVVRSLYKRANSGDTTAMIFWLKNRRGKDWREKQEIEHSGGVKIIRDDI